MNVAFESVSALAFMEVISCGAYVVYTIAILDRWLSRKKVSIQLSLNGLRLVSEQHNKSSHFLTLAYII